MRMLRKFFIFNFILMFLLLSSCATKPKAPIKDFVRTAASSEESLARVETIGIINDVCLVRDITGNDDYVSIEDSKLAEAHMTKSACAYMEQKGYTVKVHLSPFVGGFKTPDKETKVADCKGGDVTMHGAPFYTHDTIREDKPFQESLIHSIRKALAAVDQMKKSPSEAISFDDETQKYLKHIADHENIDTALFIIGNGVIVSTGKSVGQAVATGMLTGILTMGMVTYSKYDVSYLDSYIVLVDLKSGKMLWSNSFRKKQIDPTEEEFYTKNWAATALYHLPNK
ncbi:MAG: hypothetical protein FP816_07970 [Desulfobacteraceae bacterium]|nr:hypothetical protein [Desulfobacteraceae bacterium]MBU4053861.1 hypothetical protein [Pseudomonadota bacterium]